MIEPVVDWLRRMRDPLRNPAQIRRFIARLPANDVLEVQRASLELLANFADGGGDVTATQLEALLALDARLEPVIADLTRQYTANYQKSSTVESRLWHSVFDLVKAFIAAYHASLQAGFTHAENRRWRAILPWALVRLAHYRGLDGKFRLFRYSHWIPAQWRDFHETYELARARSWHREQLVFGAAGFSRPGISVEQVYLDMLLLMRLDSGNFTPDQVEWVAKQLEDWAPSLALTPVAAQGAGFYIDLAGAQGLRRREQPTPIGHLMYVDTGPVYTRIVERLRWLPENDDAPTAPGELPAREQRLLLMRLAALYGPDALAHAPRATRRTADEHVRVVSGLHALTRAVAEIDRLPDAVRTPGIAASYDEATLINPGVNPASIERRVRGTRWKMVDRSESGCRLMAPAKEAPAKLGELLAIKDGDNWILGVVRRMQRQQVDEMTVGVEIIARRLVRVLMRSFASPADASRATQDKPFFGVYLPAAPENRQSSQRSLIGPDDRFVPAGMVELDTGSARYLIRFTQTLERQTGWTWTLYNAVRKLST
jgi:hypothetical protein